MLVVEVWPVVEPSCRAAKLDGLEGGLRAAPPDAARAGVVANEPTTDDPKGKPRIAPDADPRPTRAPMPPTPPEASMLLVPSETVANEAAKGLRAGRDAARAAATDVPGDGTPGREEDTSAAGTAAGCMPNKISRVKDPRCWVVALRAWGNDGVGAALPPGGVCAPTSDASTVGLPPSIESIGIANDEEREPRCKYLHTLSIAND